MMKFAIYKVYVIKFNIFKRQRSAVSDTLYYDSVVALVISSLDNHFFIDPKEHSS